MYFVSFAVVYWIDLFIRNEYKNILLESWKYCQSKKGLDLYAWIIMSSHVHLIIGSHENKLEDIMRDMKKTYLIRIKKGNSKPSVRKQKRMVTLDDGKGRQKEQSERKLPTLAAG